MTEVEKLYENAGIKPRYRCTYRDVWCPIEDIGKYNPKCPRQAVIEICDVRTENKRLPLFTAEKQLELIKLLQRKNGYKFSFSSTNDNSEYLFFAHKDNTPVQELIVAGDKCYEEALAGFINTLWQNLAAEEQQQIKEILQ